MGKTAFDAPRTTAFTYDPDELVLISDPADPLYDERVNLPVKESLVLSMMKYGWFGAIDVVRRGDQPVVVVGHQRTKAAREANRRLKELGSQTIRVSVLLKKDEERRVYGVLIASNNHSQAETPLEKARKAGRMLGMNMPIGDIAVAFGVEANTVHQWLKILECTTAVLTAVEQGTISPTAAAQLAGLSPSDQKAALAKMIEESGGKRVTVARAARTAAEVAEASEATSAAETPGEDGESVVPKQRKKKGAPSVQRRGVKEIKSKLVEVESELSKTDRNEPLSERLIGWLNALKWVQGS